MGETTDNCAVDLPRENPRGTTFRVLEVSNGTAASGTLNGMNEGAHAVAAWPRREPKRNGALRCFPVNKLGELGAAH